MPAETHRSVALYAAIQASCVVCTATGLALPMVLLLNYHGAFHTGCATMDSLFAKMDDWKLFSSYLSIETLITRTWFLLEVQRCLAIADGRPLWDWAPIDRMMWLSGAFACALMLDAGAVIWAAQAESLCDNRTESEMRSLQGLCEHSIHIDVGMHTLHHVNAAVAVVVFALVVYWWNQLKAHEQDTDKKDE